jgi:hypothetical protein
VIEIPGIGEKMVEKIRQSVAAYFEGAETQPVEGEAGAETGEESAAVEASPENGVGLAEEELTESGAEEGNLTAENLASGEVSAEAEFEASDESETATHLEAEEKKPTESEENS